MRLIIILLSFVHFSSAANDSLTSKPSRFLIKIGAGQGYFLLSKPLNYDFASNYQSFEFGNSKQIDVNVNFSLLSKSRHTHWCSKLFIGLGLNLEQIPVKHYYYSYDNISGNPDYEFHDFNPNSFSYIVSPFSYQLNTSWLISFKNIFIYQKIGLYYTTYINRKKYPCSEHIYGWKNILGPGPAVYVDEYRQVNVKNYFNDKLNAGYLVGAGYSIKQFRPFVSIEGSTFYSNFWYSQLKYQLNLMVEF